MKSAEQGYEIAQYRLAYVYEYAEKGFENEPARCHDCRAAKRRERDGGDRQPRQMYDAVCAECGATTQVPFKPRNDRPIYCRDCFNAKKEQE